MFRRHDARSWVNTSPEAISFGHTAVPARSPEDFLIVLVDSARGVSKKRVLFLTFHVWVGRIGKGLRRRVVGGNSIVLIACSLNRVDDVDHGC